MSDFIQSINNLQKQASQKLNKQTGLGVSSTSVPNPGISILFFIIITTILLILKIVLLPSDNLEEFKKGSIVMTIITIVYMALLLFGNLLINTSVTTSLCNGTPQWSTTFLITFIPWVIIFGIINIILIIFPGWLVPFSNTFGYFIVKLFGLKSLFNDRIIVPKSNIESNINNDKINVAKALQQIYGNESLLINEIPRDGDTEETRVENFNEFYTTMQKLGIFNDKKADENENESKVSLYKLLKIKDYIAEYIWYILSGLLVSSITYNYIVNIGCNFSSAQMHDAYKSYLQDDLSQNNVNNMADNMQSSEDIFLNSSSS